ncbi:non-ribosomal peptide synthetase [Microcoleus sp. FACHB-672]|uniref:non-ribosomal peptide synthetase n=1 Tax=Microcoleus sp. FACHB-672 TaxID=2692825 RepID=UPI0016852DD4|nr:amino acid adenylation domain-containing protein [Microcoleus sp. FACHB-672]MBD2041189.1 amino acid adenylation domain-containing protein [Microcoleus sp. FACHB-672]
MNYNSTATIERSKVTGVAQIFEAQAELTPDAIAVRCEERQLTYRELNAKANQLANYLKTCGIESEVRVGICAERSLEMVIGILGILKAGGAYVPLDPAYPQERLSFILQETQLPLLLTQSHLVKALPQQSTQLLCLDTDWETIALHSDQAPAIEVKPENLAYVMYTSGSTGKPKGVQITHANVWYYIQAIAKVLEVNEQDVYLHTASFSFSSSVRQLMVPLSQGATSIIATREQIKNPLGLFELIQKQGVTVSDTVPSVWRYGLQAVEGLEPVRAKALMSSKLRMILLSGEITPCQLLQKIRGKLKNQPRIFNIYGQTETIGTCAYPIPEDFDREQGYVPVGYPYPHNQAYILNAKGQGVAVGEIGELHIAGACLSRGYLNRPELNAEKFISNPFADRPSSPSQSSSRLFKTGDLARWLPDGAIELVGRTDFQVKIRGMRVEIGEIESLLEQHPAIKETAVTAREEVPGDKRLVAYIVAHSPSTHSDKSEFYAELRSFLSEKLPDYMVPSSFVMLKALPLTPNGKLDRRALPALHSSGAGSERNIVFPRNGLERLLKEVWERVLEVKPISIKDNFFDLGGHSLVAVRLLSEIENICGKSLPLATLLQAATIEKLARIIESEGGAMQAQSLVPLNRATGKPPLFCIYGMLLYRDLARHFDTDWPVYGVYLDAEIELLKAGKLDEQTSSLTSVEDIASHYLKEIRTIQPTGPYYLAGESFGGLVAFEMGQQLRAAGERVELVALFDTRFPGETPEMSRQKRLSLHIEKLGQEGFSYVLEKVGHKLKSTKGKLVRIAGKLSGKSEQGKPQPELSEPEESIAADVRIAVRERAIEKYSPEPYAGKLALFRAMDRTAFEKYYTDPKLWRSLTINGLEVHEIGGDHLGILKEPHVKVLADKLKECLNSTQPTEVAEPVELIRS